MAIEIVDLPIKNVIFHSYVNVYQRVVPAVCYDPPYGLVCFSKLHWLSCGDFIGQSGSPAQSTRFLILLQDTVEMEP